jgi:hypothetical protein
MMDGQQLFDRTLKLADIASDSLREILRNIMREWHPEALRLAFYNGHPGFKVRGLYIHQPTRF